MRLAWLLPLACMLSQTAQARGLSIEDVLANEQYTQIVPVPRMRALIVGRTRPYKEAGDYRYDWFTVRMLSELWILSPERRERFVRLLGGEGTGYWAAGLSPSGRRLAVFRLSHDRLDLGILDLVSRKVRWLRIRPDMPYANPNPAWLDESHLLLVTRTDRSLPQMLDYAFEPARRLPMAWSATSRGVTSSVSVIGSGRMLGHRDRSPPRDLTIYDVRYGTTRRLLRGDVSDVALSPDGRRAAVVREGIDGGVDQTRPADPADLTRVHRLDIVDLTTGDVSTPCDRCDVLPNLLSWSESGLKVLFYARSPDTPWSQGGLMSATESDDGGRFRSAQVLTGLNAWIDTTSPGVIAVHAGWMGERPVLLGKPSASRGATSTDWYVTDRYGPRPLTAGEGPATRVLTTGPTQFTYLSKGRLMRATPDGPPRPVLVEDGIELGSVPLDPLLDGTRRMLNPEHGGVTLAVRRGGLATPIDVSRSGSVTHRYTPVPSTSRTLATLPACDAVLSLKPTRGGSSTLELSTGRRVTTFGEINRNLEDVVALRPIVLESRDEAGVVLHHHLHLPSGGAGAVPLVVMPYPGVILPAAASIPDVALFNPTTNVQLLTAKGYAVLEPSMPPLAAGRYDVRTNVLDGMAQQIEHAIRAAIATGRVDPTRVAVYGHSYGGYAALAMATRGDVVRRVIASAAPINLAAAYGFIDPRNKTQEDGVSTTIAFGWFEGGQGGLGEPPWEASERYVASSPLFRAGRVTVPVLLVHGEFDYVPVEGAEQFFMALYRQNKTSLLLRYGAEGHVIRSPGNIRDEWAHIFAWLEQMNAPPSSDAVSERASDALPVADPRLYGPIEHEGARDVAP